MARLYKSNSPSQTNQLNKFVLHNPPSHSSIAISNWSHK